MSHYDVTVSDIEDDDDDDVSHLLDGGHVTSQDREEWEIITTVTVRENGTCLSHTHTLHTHLLSCCRCSLHNARSENAGLSN